MNRILSLALVVSCLFGCRNRDDIAPRNESGELVTIEKGIDVNFTDEVEGIETIPLAIEGTWQVTEYSKEKIDQTNFFEGFTFTFNPDGSVLAVKDDIEVLGKYEVVPTGDSNDLIITFPATTPFPSLNYTWTNVIDSEGILEFEMNNKDLVLERQ